MNEETRAPVDDTMDAIVAADMPEAATAPKEPDKPKAEPIRLTLERCSRVMGELTRKQCYVFDSSHSCGQYLKEFGMGHSYTREHAHRYTPREAQELWGTNIHHNLLIELIDQDLALEISTRKIPKCSIEQALRASLIELLKVAPLNPTARACIMRETTKMPPDSCKTYEELKAWVEENCEPRLSADYIRGAQAAIPEVVRAAENGTAFTATLRFQNREFGSATFWQNQDGVGDYEVSTEQVSSLVRRLAEQGITRPSIGYIVNQLVIDIAEDAWEVEPDMEACGDPIYDHDDTQGTDRQVVSPDSEASFRESLRDYLRATLPPEQAARIEGL